MRRVRGTADMLSGREATTSEPTRAHDEGVASYWHGSAAGEVHRWGARALAVEAACDEVRRLRAR